MHKRPTPKKPGTNRRPRTDTLKTTTEIIVFLSIYFEYLFRIHCFQTTCHSLEFRFPSTTPTQRFFDPPDATSKGTRLSCAAPPRLSSGFFRLGDSALRRKFRAICIRTATKANRRLEGNVGARGRRVNGGFLPSPCPIYQVRAMVTTVRPVRWRFFPKIPTCRGGFCPTASFLRSCGARRSRVD